MDGYSCPSADRSWRSERHIYRRYWRFKRKDHRKSKGKIYSYYQSVNFLHLSRTICLFCQARFDISLNPRSLHFVFLNTRYLVEDSTWPHFTLLGQSIGSMYLAWEAMSILIPDLYIGQWKPSTHSIGKRNCIFFNKRLCFLDTMGYAFTFHVVILLGRIPVGAYVHYPTISTDMLARVKSRTKWHTNTDIISSSKALSHAKLL